MFSALLLTLINFSFLKFVSKYFVVVFPNAMYKSGMNRKIWKWVFPVHYGYIFSPEGDL